MLINTKPNHATSANLKDRLRPRPFRSISVSRCPYTDIFLDTRDTLYPYLHAVPATPNLIDYYTLPLPHIPHLS